jgi:integrase
MHTTDDERGAIKIDVPREGHATVFFSSGGSMTFPDEAWPRAIAVIREDLGLSPPPLRQPDNSPAETAPMKYTAKNINKLVEQIRSGQPPELPEGKREKHYRDPALPGLYIRVLNTGVASWVVQWKRLGRQKKKTLGDVLVLDRLAAIKAAKELLAKITLDLLDPHEARRERMRANKVTFATLVPLFFEKKKQKGEMKSTTEINWKLYLTDYYFKPLHNLPVDEITRDQIQTLIDIIASQSGNRTARACVTVIRLFFKWASQTGKIPAGHHNPTNDIQQPAPNPSRDRVLSDDEIQLIIKTCDAWEAQAIHDQQFGVPTGKPPNNPDFPRAVKLLFLTGCRRDEIAKLQWPEVNLDRAKLEIPGSRRKSRKSKELEMDLCVPLADTAVQILRSLPRRPNNDFVFGGRRTILGLVMKDTRKRIDKRIAKTGNAPLPKWTIHDIRRTFRTKLAALGVSMDVGEALVGHVGHRTKMDRIYNRYKYWPEMRQALAKYEAHLRAIIDGTAEKITYWHFGEQTKGGTA